MKISVFLFLIFVILILLFIIFIQSVLYEKNKDIKVVPDPFKKDYEKYKPSLEEIKEVKRQIEEKGYYIHRYEWKLMTETDTRIELKNDTNDIHYLVTINCSSTIIFRAATIERALHFKKIYESLDQELFYNIGYACWKSKNEL